jgi:hypothetical protein
MLIIQFGVMLVAAAFLAAPGAEGMYFVLLLAAQAVLAGAALVFSLLPRAGAWFRDGAAGSRRT